MKNALAIGLMSGSSLDGLDIALVQFTSSEGHYTYHIEAAETIPYPDYWHKQLAGAFLHKPEELGPLDTEYGNYLGQQVLTFEKKHGVRPDFVASHGHTIFHKPEQHYTLQIGDGQAVADACGIVVVNDFRSEDVGKGGQGAPLVPIGDRLLFGDYEICLNIGGIANLSYELNGKRIAYDICIANQALNWLAQQEGLNYDKDGLLAQKGQLDTALLEKLNNNAFYHQAPPKSLGREFFEAFQKDLLKHYATADALATFTEHIAIQVAQAIAHLPQGKMLITGGGAHNNYLVERIQHHTRHQVVVPDRQTVDYKEALIFALLGLLRLEGNVNVLSSVTGAPSDSCSGKIWHPTSKLQ
ncbi:MAG: anhydro-N-acetylmuramic acid kinase [Bacteroidales bacterium]|nr:anhydro-N-acetylmuramic acid kinase [Bacteroidales bacterium]